MDPPQEGEQPLALAGGVVGEVAARLGFGGVGVGVGEEGLELMEHLGLGEGTRIVDLQVCLTLFNQIVLVVILILNRTIFRLGSTNLPSRHYLPSPTTPIPTRIPIHIPHTPLPHLLIPSTYTNRTSCPSPPPRHLLILMPMPMPTPTPTPTHVTNHQHTTPRVSMLPKPLLPSASQLPLGHLLYLFPLVLRPMRLLLRHHQHHHHHHHHQQHHHLLPLLRLITHLIIQFIRASVSPSRLLGL